MQKLARTGKMVADQNGGGDQASDEEFERGEDDENFRKYMPQGLPLDPSPIAVILLLKLVEALW